MPTGRDDVCFRGQIGSGWPIVKPTQLTQNGRGPLAAGIPDKGTPLV
jgi:hypothetical protein